MFNDYKEALLIYFCGIILLAILWTVYTCYLSYSVEYMFPFAGVGDSDVKVFSGTESTTYFTST